MPQRLSNTVAEELSFELESYDSFPLDVLYENGEHAAGFTVDGQFTQKGLSSGSLFPITNAGDRLQQTVNATSSLECLCDGGRGRPVADFR